MALMTEAEIGKLLFQCTDYKTKTCTYTRLLGFRQLSQSKCENGPQKYTGIVQEFYEATRDEVNTYAAHYKSRREIQEAVRDQTLVLSVFDQCLDHYGPKVWNNGEDEPFVTLRDEIYKRYLIFEDTEDRER
jgi:hypothetical protein